MLVAEHAGVGQWEQLISTALQTGLALKQAKDVKSAAAKAQKQAMVEQQQAAAQASQAAQAEAMRQQQVYLTQQAGVPIWVWIAAGVAGVTVLGGAAYFLLRK